MGVEVKALVEATKLCTLAVDDTVVMKEWQTQIYMAHYKQNK